MALTYLHSDAVRPLHQLIRPIKNAGSDCYAPLSPDLQIFLTNNSLEQLPSALWDLENITVLSLRSNLLTDIPSAIGRLGKLKELNLAGNGIRWLPWELLGLLRGQGLSLVPHPNPLWECAIIPAAPAETGEPIFCGSSRKCYFEVDGTLHRSSQDMSSTSGSTPWPIEHMSFDQTPGHASQAQSLFETASKVILQYLSQVPATTAEQVEPVAKAVERCRELQHQHIPTCSTCGQTYLFKRAEWVEYWYCNVSGPSKVPNYYVLPFMRRACTWGCAR